MKKFITILSFIATYALAETLNFNVDPLSQGQFSVELIAEDLSNGFGTRLNSATNIDIIGSFTAGDRVSISNVASAHAGIVLKDTNQVADEVVLSNAIHGLQVEIERSITNNAPYSKGFLKALRADVNTYLKDGGTTLAEWKRAMRKSVRTGSLKNGFIDDWSRAAIIGQAYFGVQYE